MSNVINIDITVKDLGHPKLNEMKMRMTRCLWLEMGRDARPTEDPSTWDHSAIQKLDEISAHW